MNKVYIRKIYSRDAILMDKGTIIIFNFFEVDECYILIFHCFVFIYIEFTFQK